MCARCNARTVSNRRLAGRKRSIRNVLLFPALFAVCGLALAHSGAEGIVKERMELMKSIAGQMKMVGRMIKGEKDFVADQVAIAAEAIVGHAEKIPELFPEGSIEPPSEAVTAIWQDWDKFVRLTNDMKLKAQALGMSARQSEDIKDIRPQFGALGKTCSACHEDFRKSE